MRQEVSWHHHSSPDGELISTNSSPDGDMASSNTSSRPVGDAGSSSSPPLLQDTPTDPQAAAREGKLSIRLAALS